jgi:hypothetical protein
MSPEFEAHIAKIRHVAEALADSLKKAIELMAAALKNKGGRPRRKNRGDESPGFEEGCIPPSLAGDSQNPASPA